jgi:hypothetical protein
MSTPADEGILAARQDAERARIAQYKELLVTAAHILLSAENAIMAAYEQGETPNQIAGTILDVPTQLKQVTTLLDTVLILNRRTAKPKLYPAVVNGKHVMVTIPED